MIVKIRINFKTGIIMFAICEAIAIVTFIYIIWRRR